MFTSFHRSFPSFLVHALTASCVLLGFWAVLLIYRGDSGGALRVLGLATFIDSIDGTLARTLDVKRRMPQIDGALLDNIADYITWVFVPFLWVYVFAGASIAVVSFGLMTSIFGFSHTAAKTEDHFFRGFPSYWNFLILYFFVFGADPLYVNLVLLVCAVLVLVPLKLIYPSRTSRFFRLTLVLSLPYAVLLVSMLWLLHETPLWIPLVSLYYPVYYVTVSAIAASRGRGHGQSNPAR